jgi:hypothetical protein
MRVEGSCLAGLVLRRRDELHENGTMSLDCPGAYQAARLATESLIFWQSRTVNVTILCKIKVWQKPGEVRDG